MTTKHTPGPWKLRTDSTLGGLYSEIVGRDAIYNVWGVVVSKIPTKNAEQIANAHLIAAAPEMLAALVDAETVLGENLQFITDLADLAIRQRDSETLKRLEQLNGGWLRLVKAIAKAKGHTSQDHQDKQGEV